MRINLLGPVELLLHGDPIPLTPKERTLLAALALSPGVVVPHQRLVAALWEGFPPPSSRSKLHAYVSAIRRAIGQPGPAGGPLYTCGRDYRLNASRDELDLLEFAGLVAQARQLHADGQLPAASERFEDALRIWRGPACGTVESGVIRAAAESLEQKRMLAIDDKAAIDLELGRCHAVVERLTVQVLAAPLRERTRALLMLALYRRGCRADALELYRAGRQVLASELGLEPGPELYRIHQAMLLGNERLLTGRVADVSAHVDE